MSAGRPGPRHFVTVSVLVLGASITMIGPGRVPLELDRTALVPAAAPAIAPAIRAASLADVNLGLATPTNRTVARLTDTASGQALNEVTDLDAAGVPMAISRFDLAGSLISAVRLGYVEAPASVIPASSAGRAASAVLAQIGIAPAGSPTITARASGGWLVRWVRRSGGIAVPGDGVAVQLDPAGAFHAVVRTEHALASMPPATIDATRAGLLATARLDAWFPAGVRGEATIGAIEQAWILPNDTFGDALPGGQQGQLHLAWIIRVTMSGTLARTVTGLELAFDAGSGLPLGGDVLE